MTSLVVYKVIGGGVVTLERVQVICPACGQQVDAVATDGRVKGYCAVTRRLVNFPIETQRVRIAQHHTAETRAKMSAAHKGKHLTAETKAKMSAAHKGKHPTAEHRAEMSAALKKRWQDPEYRAQHPKAETKVKLSAAAQKRYQDPGYQAKQIATHTGKRHTAEARAKMSAALLRPFCLGQLWQGRTVGSMAILPRVLPLLGFRPLPPLPQKYYF